MPTFVGWTGAPFRSMYVVGRRRVRICPDCAQEAREEGRKVRKMTKAEFRAGWTRTITDKDPVHCSNCCAPVNILGR